MDDVIIKKSSKAQSGIIALHSLINFILGNTIATTQKKSEFKFYNLQLHKNCTVLLNDTLHMTISRYEADPLSKVKDDCGNIHYHSVLDKLRSFRANLKSNKSTASLSSTLLATLGTYMPLYLDKFKNQLSKHEIVEFERTYKMYYLFAMYSIC